MSADESWIVKSDELPWRPTPHAGVRWKKLRYDAESGQSVVLLEFEAGARYGSHRHPAGEEYYVLSGSIEDAGRSYAAGSYVWHPPDSVHRPASREGCRLLVWLAAPIEEL